MSENPFAGKRTEDEITQDLRAGRLDPSEVKVVETAVIEKFDMTEERTLVETRTVVAVNGVVTEHIIQKH